MLEDEVMEIVLGNVSGMGILEETDAGNFPFVVFKWVREDVGFQFEDLVVKEIIVFPISFKLNFV